MITIDYTCMMADVIGPERGITPAELDLLAGPAASIHADLQQRRAAGALPFYELPFASDDCARIRRLADELAGQCDALVVLGIGGSALGTTALARALLPTLHNQLGRAARHGRPRLYVLDNVDPVSIAELLAHLDPAATCFCVISKSGATVETMAQFLVARQWLLAALGAAAAVERMVFVTDARKGVLRRLADSDGYRTLAVPDGVGGRFSVLSAVGLLPLATAGVDIERLLAGAAAFAPSLTLPALDANPAYLNAALQYLAYDKGMPISVLMPYSDQLRDVADWFRQLWAESLGKSKRSDGRLEPVGPTPVRALGATDQHSQMQLYMEGPADKVISFIRVDDTPDLVFPSVDDIPELAYLSGRTAGELLRCEQMATAAALARHGRPSTTLQLQSVSPESLGALIYLFEVQTLFAGGLFAVDPLDQPGVEAGKVYAAALLGAADFGAVRNDLENWLQQVERRIL